MRPVGALIFGTRADRVGRRIPLMVDVCFYSLVGSACVTPNFTVLLGAHVLEQPAEFFVHGGSALTEGELTVVDDVAACGCSTWR